MSSATDSNYILYDENLAAGLIARTDPPIRLNYVNVSAVGITYNTGLEVNNDVYIDIITTNGYDEGNIITFTFITKD